MPLSEWILPEGNGRSLSKRHNAADDRFLARPQGSMGMDRWGLDRWGQTRLIDDPWIPMDWIDGVRLD